MINRSILNCPVSKAHFQAAMRRLPALKVDRGIIAAARSSAAKIAASVQEEIVSGKSTVSIERATLTLMGVRGAKEVSGHPQEYWPPLVNVIVENIKDPSALNNGIARPFANAMLAKGENDIQVFAEKVATENLDVTAFPAQKEADVASLMKRLTQEGLGQLDQKIDERALLREGLGTSPPPLLYLIVATGNIIDDARQARIVARDGADIVAVIRHSAQSLLDYIPYGQLAGGEGGTYATRENMHYMRAALDDVGEELGRYIQLVNYASGLAMPELAAIAAQEKLDILLNDAMYGILFRDINPYRTFLDQHYSRLVCAYARITINTGEDNYLTNADAVDYAHTVYASDLINEQLALQTHLPTSLMGLGHAYEIDPAIDNSYLLQLSEALLSRQLFPEHPLKYMPPTKFIGGDMLAAQALHVGFNEVTYLTAQTILLLGIMSEGSRNPHLEERRDAIRNAQHVIASRKDKAGIISTKGNILEQRANNVLGNVLAFLQKVEKTGILKAIAEGQFADMRRSADGGHGKDGVFVKGPDYVNPIFAEIERRLVE